MCFSITDDNTILLILQLVNKKGLCLHTLSCWRTWFSCTYTMSRITKSLRTKLRNKELEMECSRERFFKTALWNSFCVDLPLPPLSLWTKVAVFHLKLGYMLLHFTPPCKETTSLGGERAAAPETDLQLAAEATGIQPEQTPVPFHLTSRKNPTRWQTLRMTIRN